MLDIITKLGFSGALGALLGFAMVFWVEPTTTGGSILIVIIWVLVFIVAGEIISKLLGKKVVAKQE
jgi:hypothetical protein